jgi:hypothetical protein
LDRKGPKWLAIALHEAALAATRSKGSYLWALYKRLRPRIGHARALGAVKHSMICAYWHMFATGQLYSDLAASKPSATPSPSPPTPPDPQAEFPIR